MEKHINDEKNVLTPYLLPAFFIIMAAVLAVWIMNSNGFYFIDDSCHFNYNRHFFSYYFHESVSSWSRLGRVWLFALPAQFGLKGVQIFSGLLFLLTIYFAYKILIIKKVKYAEWVVLIIGFQPVLFNISYSVLAELPAAFLIVLAYYLYKKDKYIWVMIASSFIFNFRTEYYYVAGLFFLIFLFKKRWNVLPFILTGPVVWFLHSWITSGNIMLFFYDLGLHSRLPRISEGIEFIFYFWRSFQIYGLLQVLFFLTAIIVLLFNRQIKDYILILLIILGGIGFHTLAALKGLNVSCSVGQLRYVAVVGPMVGVISCVGISWFFGLLKNKIVKILIGILLISLMFLSGPFVTPFHKKLKIEEISDRIVSIAQEQYPDYKILTSLHYIANSLDEAKDWSKNSDYLTKENLDKYSKALILWVKELEDTPFGVPSVKLKELEADTSKIKLIYQYAENVNHNPDLPVYRFYDNAPDNIKWLINYLIMDQYTWEDVNVKLYVKGK